MDNCRDHDDDPRQLSVGCTPTTNRQLSCTALVVDRRRPRPKKIPVFIGNFGLAMLVVSVSASSAFVSTRSIQPPGGPPLTAAWHQTLSKDPFSSRFVFCAGTRTADGGLSGDDSYGSFQEFGRTSPRDELWHERSKRWVVIVDDEEAIRTAVGQFLFDRGYQVTACADADTALKVCRSTRAGDAEGGSAVPDVIVSDVRMPGIDGLELLRILRSDEDLVGVPVVLLTAKGMTDDRIAGYQAGADAYVPKPFDPEELLAIIDNSIRRHETVSGDDVEVDDLKKDLDEIKYLLLERGGGGVGNGWVKKTNVFLTPDERQVLELLCKGMMNKEIAEATYLSIRRVEQHLTSMFRKTGVSNRTELVRWAVSTGNVEL